jgi:hypothetical protein
MASSVDSPGSLSGAVCPFDRLPNEIICHIMKDTLPHGFESFILTCKHFHKLAKEEAVTLAYHNQLRRRFRDFEFPYRNPFRPNAQHPTETVSELLMDIATWPIIAEYMVVVDLQDRQAPLFRVSNQHYYRRHEDNGWTRAHINDLRRLVKKSKLLAKTGQSHREWFKGILRDCSSGLDRRDFATAFLLTLLPNVERLSLPEHWHEAMIEPEENRPHVPSRHWSPPRSDMSKLVCALIRNARNPNLTSQPLSKLRAIGWQWPDSQAMPPRSIAPVIPFLSLNAVRYAHITEAIFETSPHIWTRCRPIGSNLRCLSLDECTIDADMAPTLFNDMRKLHFLDYKVSMMIHGAHFWNPQKFLDNLPGEMHARLRRFNWTVHQVWGLTPLLGMESPFNMRNFTKLRHLTLDTRLFIVSSSTCQNSSYDDVPTTLEGMAHLPGLEATLPLANLRTLTMNMSATSEDLQCMKILFREWPSPRDRQSESRGPVVTVKVNQRSVWDGTFLPYYAVFTSFAKIFARVTFDSSIMPAEGQAMRT